MYKNSIADPEVIGNISSPELEFGKVCDYECSNYSKEKCFSCKWNKYAKKSYYEPIEEPNVTHEQIKVYPYFPYSPDTTIQPPKIWYYKTTCDATVTYDIDGNLIKEYWESL